MAPALGLADDQLFTLMKFKRNIRDVLQPHHDDQFLLRWLRARKWDVAAAEKMLRDSLEWRKIWQVDDIADWKLPPLLQKYLAWGRPGFDKDGAPVIIVPFSGTNMYGLLNVVSKTEVIKATIQALESSLELCRAQAKIHGPVANQLTVVFDMENFDVREYTWRPARELVVMLIQMYEGNYPEILKICYIINAPKIFAFAFALIKKFMNEYTLSKIQIYKADRSKWQPEILKVIPANQLPKHYGGTLTDPDGNPLLTTKICWGGRVPKELYRDKADHANENANEEFQSATIKKGDKLMLDFTSQKEGDFLRWDFKCEDHDIKFGIVMKDNSGQASDVIPIHRVQANNGNEMGYINCKASTRYSVIFDNSYSIVRNKKLFYCVEMVSSI